MRVYKDRLTGDEMFSDSHKIKLINDVVYEVDSKHITVSNAVDSKLLGANPSGENEEDEGVNDTAERVIDLVHGSRLVETQFDAKSYQVYLKDFLKKTKERLATEDPNRVPIFEENIKAYMKNVFQNFKDYQFFMGESMNPEGLVTLMNYREDGVTPYFVFIKDGLIEEKY